MKTKIYIAGKITGEDYNTVTKKFALAEEQLQQLGYDVYNPISIVDAPNCDWKKAMIICIKVLLDCEEAYFLPDWANSKGAIVEYGLAKALGITMHMKIPQDSPQPTLKF